MAQNENKRITVNLNPRVEKKLKRLADYHRRSLSTEAALAIEAHIQKLNPDSK